MSKLITYVPLSSVERIELRVTNCRKTLSQVKAETKAHYVLNGGMWNPDGTPCPLLKVGGAMLSGTDATGLNVHCFLSYAHGGSQQIGARIAYNEFDLVLFFNDPNNEAMVGDVSYISRLCDQNNIPFASNLATAEALVLGLARGDLDWRCIVNPSNRPIA